MEKDRKKENAPLFGIIKIALEEIGYGGTATSSAYMSTASGATFTSGIVRIGEGSGTPVYLWASGSPLPSNFVKEIGEKRSDEGEKGAIFVSPVAYPVDSIDCLKKYGYDYITFDDIEKKLEAKGARIGELRGEVEREKIEIQQRGGYSKAKIYEKLIADVEGSLDNDSKKKTLEGLVAFFAQDVGLKEIEIDKRTASSEIDVRAKNERTTGIWKERDTYNF